MGPLLYANTIKSKECAADREVTFSLRCSWFLTAEVIRLRRVTHTMKVPSRKASHLLRSL